MNAETQIKPSNDISAEDARALLGGTVEKTSCGRGLRWRAPSGMCVLQMRAHDSIEQGKRGAMKALRPWARSLLALSEATYGNDHAEGIFVAELLEGGYLVAVPASPLVDIAERLPFKMRHACEIDTPSALSCGKIRATITLDTNGSPDDEEPISFLVSCVHRPSTMDVERFGIIESIYARFLGSGDEHAEEGFPFHGTSAYLRKYRSRLLEALARLAREGRLNAARLGPALSVAGCTWNEVLGLLGEEAWHGTPYAPGLKSAWAGKNARDNVLPYFENREAIAGLVELVRDASPDELLSIRGEIQASFDSRSTLVLQDAPKPIEASLDEEPSEIDMALEAEDRLRPYFAFCTERKEWAAFVQSSEPDSEKTAGVWHVGHAARKRLRDEISLLVTQRAERASRRNVGTVTRIEEALRVALHRDDAAFDADTNLLGIGPLERPEVIDLRSGERRPMMVFDYFTKTTGTLPDDDSEKMKEWEAFLVAIFTPTGTEPDEKSTAYVSILRDALTLALFGETGPYVLVLQGHGANGKSILVDSVYRALGSYSTPIGPKEILSKEAHLEGLNYIRGFRLAVCDEATEGEAWDTGRLKALTGGMAFLSRGMGRGFQKAHKPTASFVLLANKRPEIRNGTHAEARRLLRLVLPNRYETNDSYRNRILSLAPVAFSWLLAHAPEISRRKKEGEPLVRIPESVRPIVSEWIARANANAFTLRDALEVGEPRDFISTRRLVELLRIIRSTDEGDDGGFSYRITAQTVHRALEASFVEGRDYVQRADNRGTETDGETTRRARGIFGLRFRAGHSPEELRDQMGPTFNDGGGLPI